MKRIECGQSEKGGCGDGGKLETEGFEGREEDEDGSKIATRKQWAEHSRKENS